MFSLKIILTAKHFYILKQRCRLYSKIIPFKLADIGEGITEVELMQWFVKEGDAVKSFDRLCEVQSDKATVEITSRYDGEIVKIYHNIGEVVKVNYKAIYYFIFSLSHIELLLYAGGISTSRHWSAGRVTSETDDGKSDRHEIIHSTHRQ